MSSTIHDGPKTEESQCCFWLKHSQTCHNIKTAALSITAALAAIALVTAVLCVLANQGVNLGGINAFAQMIETPWIYTALSLAGAVLIVDSALIIALVRSHTNKFFSEKELQKYKLTGYVKDDQHIAEKMDPNTFWTLNSLGKQATQNAEATPPAYVLLTKDGKGHVSAVAYKKDEDRSAHIKNLGATYHDAKQAFAKSPVYPPGYVVTVMGHEPLMHVLRQLSKNLPESFYRSRKIALSATENATFFALAKGGQTHYHFIKEGQEANFMKEGQDGNYNYYNTLYQGTLDRDFTDAAVNKEFAEKVPAVLKEKQYWTFDVRSSVAPLYAVALRTQGATQAEVRYFTQAKGRDDFVSAHCAGWTDAKTMFNDTDHYEAQDVLVSAAEDIKWFTDKLTLRAMEYARTDIKTKSGAHIYAAAHSKDGKEIVRTYYKSPIYREKFFSSLPKVYIDSGTLNDYIYNDQNGLIAKQNLRERCQTNDYFMFEHTVNGTQLYALIYKVDDAGRFDLAYWRSKAERDAATQQEAGLFAAAKGYRDLVKHEAMRAEYENELKNHIYGKPYGTGGTIAKNTLNQLATQDFMYVKDNYTINGKAIYVIIYRAREQDKQNVYLYKTFNSDEERTQFLNSDAGKKYQDVNAVYIAPGQYRPDYATKILTPEQSQTLKLAQDQLAKGSPKEYIKINFPIRDKKVVYALSCYEWGFFAKKAYDLYFNSEEARQNFIKTRLPDHKEAKLNEVPLVEPAKKPLSQNVNDQINKIVFGDSWAESSPMQGTCTLTFANGQTVTASINSAEANLLIHALDKNKFSFEKGKQDPVTYFKNEDPARIRPGLTALNVVEKIQKEMFSVNQAKIKKNIPQADQNTMKNLLGISNTLCYSAEVDGTDKKTYYMLSIGGAKEVQFFESAEERQKVIQASGCSSLNVVLHNIYGAQSVSAKSELKLKSTVNLVYVKDECTVDGRNFFCLVYTNNGGLSHRVWNSENERTAFLNSDKKYVEMNSVFAATGLYQKDFAMKLLTTEQQATIQMGFNALENCGEKDFAKFDSQTADKVDLFTLAYYEVDLFNTKTGKLLHFATDAARAEFINRSLPGFSEIPASKLPTLIDPVQATKMIDPTFMQCINDSAKQLEGGKNLDYFKVNVPTTDKQGTVYTLIYNKKVTLGLSNSGVVLHFTTKEGRETFIQKNLSNYTSGEVPQAIGAFVLHKVWKQDLLSQKEASMNQQRILGTCDEKRNHGKRKATTHSSS